MDERIHAIIRRVKEFLERRYGPRLKAVILYGSHARGTATKDSDVDLLAVVDDSLDPWRVRRSLDNLLFEVLLETGELVSVIVIPQSHYESSALPFLMNVRREGVRV